jgi:hypothetical protein
MSIKSKFAFSINCYKELVNLISEVLPTGHKMPKDMHQSKKLLEGVGMEYEKIDVCQDNCMRRVGSLQPSLGFNDFHHAARLQSLTNGHP